jgi:hypothetical protein
MSDNHEEIKLSDPEKQETLTIHFVGDEIEGYGAWIDELPLISEGKTIPEALINIANAYNDVIKHLKGF